MYVARKIVNGRLSYRLRQSMPDGSRVVFRELFDLGEDPAAYIIYPGGNSFYFSDELMQSLSDQGVEDADRKLESALLPFLDPDIQRIVIQMTRLGRKKRVSSSKEAMARAQARLHLFDRRRLYYIRFGRLDSPTVIMRPHKFLNTPATMSRDELEYHIHKLELSLRMREKKQYVYQAMDLGRFFPGEFAKLFPLGLDQDKLDEVFLNELCRLNSDPSFMDQEPGGGFKPAFLSEYLVRYVIYWFDFEFGQRPPRDRLFEEFRRSHAGYKPPAPAGGIELKKACLVFSITIEEWTNMNKDELARIYRRLALECHPDQGGEQEKFIELNNAYDRLIEGK